MGGLGTKTQGFFVPGANCWRVERARQAAVLIDGCEYFLQLRRALLAAQRSVFVLGWDFDSYMRLDPRGLEGPADESVGEVFERIVEANAELHVYILIWNMAPLIGSSDLPTLVWGTRLAHPRIHVKLDSHHPVMGCHHQKLVCIDDSIAFCGGIDITSGRWDEPSHPTVHPLRVGTNGKFDGPVHDVQMAVDGAAAAALADLARSRWQRATGEALTPIDDSPTVWPAGLDPLLRDVDVAIARTDPPMDGGPPVREAEALNVDAISRAKRVIYLETQYFSAGYLSDLLCEILERRDGPEVVVVVTRESHGWIEDVVMSRNRDRLIRRLKQADKFDRFRAFFAMAPGDPPREITIHSKVVVVDDWFLRVGSSNMNNRSRGLDTECDLAVEGACSAIVEVRDRLLAEHVGATPDAFAAEVARLGSVVAAIDSLNGGPRRLCPFDVGEDDGPADPLPGIALLDPDEPFSIDYLWRAVVG